MNVLDHTTIYRRYPGQWVVLDRSRTKVLVADMTLRGALRKYQLRYHLDSPPSVLKVPTKLIPFVGAS